MLTIQQIKDDAKNIPDALVLYGRLREYRGQHFFTLGQKVCIQTNIPGQESVDLAKFECVTAGLEEDARFIPWEPPLPLPPPPPPAPPPPRQPLSGTVLERVSAFFKGNGNKPATVREIAEGTGDMDQTVRICVMQDRFFERQSLEDYKNRFVWRMKPQAQEGFVEDYQI